MTVEIIEILGPSVQGKARPYRCRGDDGYIYYVKGRQTNRASLWHEWICAHLGRSFGLHIPPFEIVEVGEDLLRETPNEWRDLGAGPAFGSRLYPEAAWMELGFVDWIPLDVQRDVLVFDWWIKNGDRLTGNPNLLVDVTTKKLVVIDHNLAFDKNFCAEQFHQHHVFAKNWTLIDSDLVVQAEYLYRMMKALECLPAACHNVPEAWWWANAEMDVPASFDLATIHQTLNQCANSELWSSV